MDREEGITLVKVLQGDHWDGLFDGNVLAAPDILQNLLLAAGLLYRDVHIIHFTGDPDEDVIAPQYVQLSVLKFSDVIAPLDTLFQQKQLEMSDKVCDERVPRIRVVNAPRKDKREGSKRQSP